MSTTMKNTTKVIIALFLLLNFTVSVSATRSYLRNSRVLEEKSSCNVDIQFGECPIPEISLDNGCQNPFQVVTLRYNGGDCVQSNNLLERHEFTCDDMNGGPPNNSSSSMMTNNTNYITVTSRSGNETYFAGNVSIGEEYTLNADEQYSVLNGELTIMVYENQGGNLLQKTNLLMDCTNQLYLFDRFGASQVMYWKEIDGREVQIPDATRTGSISITVNNPDESSSSTIRLVEMTLIGNMQDEPIDYTPEVKDVMLQQQQTISLNPFEFEYDYGINRTRYTLFTTIIAESLDGSEQCNNYAVLECIL